MGAFHGAQICKLVGLFMLSQLRRLPNFQKILYRDDGIVVTSSTPRQQQKLRQEIIKNIWRTQDEITIDINLLRVDYLDVTLDLETVSLGTNLYMSLPSVTTPSDPKELPQRD